jgi:hypothetical protein
MARLIQVANVEGNKEGMTDFSAIPAGKYIGMIVKSEFKATKAKTGHYLNLSIKIVEGKHKGKLLFAVLNLDNPSQVAVEIANKELNSICQACEKSGVEESEELHGIPMELTVALVPATAQRPASNDIKFYATPKEGVTPDAGTVDTSGITSEPAAEGGNKLPWEK